MTAAAARPARRKPADSEAWFALFALVPVALTSWPALMLLAAWEFWQWHPVHSLLAMGLAVVSGLMWDDEA